MWLLEWLPDWLFYVILFLGVVGLSITYFLNKVIFFSATYILPVRIVSYVALIFGLFMVGAIHDNNKWKERVEEMESKVAKAEEQSKAANQQIDAKTEATKTKIIQKQVLVKQYIDREITKYDSQCIIPKEFIKAHNDAAEQPK
jgi:DNA-binding protein YbaB